MSERTLRLPMKDPVSGCQRVRLEKQIWCFGHQGIQLVLLFALLVALMPACRKSTSHKTRAKSNRPVSAPQQLVPLMAPNAIDKLKLAHFESASIVIPLGTRWARPVVVVIHGNDDSPETNCEAWSTITEHGYFVLCPALRAAPNGDAGISIAACSSVECLADEIRDALVVLRKRFGRYVAKNEVVLAGFDGGAARAVPIALQNPAVFPVLWLVNGGLQEWATALSTNYVERGGKLLGVVCSDQTCESDSLRVAASAQAAGLKTAIVKPGPLGIIWEPRLTQATRLAFKSSMPKGWPWTVPGQAEHTTSQP